MKLAIFIPAYNEESTIGPVLAAIKNLDFKKKLPRITDWQVFVIDDGSTDRTAEIARNTGATVIAAAAVDSEQTGALGETHIITLNKGSTALRASLHLGLANAFKIGIKTALDAGADLVVHLDADGQYVPEEIPKILEPLLSGKADFVTGDRQIGKLQFMGWPRKYGNMLGSWFLRFLTGLKVRDVSSGFRAYTKDAASKLEVHSSHTYTHVTLMEAKYKGLRIAEVPITFLPRAGGDGRATVQVRGASGNANVVLTTSALNKPKSRLTTNLLSHIFKSLADILGARKRF